MTFLRPFIAGTVLLSSILFTLWFFFGASSDYKDILLPRGSTGTRVAEILVSENIIQSPLLFRGLLKMTGGGRHIRAGEFRFYKNGNVFTALKTLYYSDPIVHTVTIPEGWTIRLIATLLAENDLVDEKKFLSLALSPKTAKKYGFDAPSLEGFLFPNTYAFSRIDGEERIIDTIVQEFKSSISQEDIDRARSMGLTLEKWVTLASIIEKETGATGEREKISSVFHNRLKKGMKLQSDPTTIYGIANFNGNLTKKNLLTPTPYNTYTIRGLPPGAIANPGKKALQAVLHPDDTKYLYFVSNNQGGHIFSETYEKHNEWVNRYQKFRGRRTNTSVPSPTQNKKR